MGRCRGCGVNLDDISSKKQAHFIWNPGGPICPTLTVFAADAVRQSKGPERHIDEEFAAGYVCKSCLRLVQNFKILRQK